VPPAIMTRPRHHNAHQRPFQRMPFLQPIVNSARGMLRQSRLILYSSSPRQNTRVRTATSRQYACMACIPFSATVSLNVAEMHGEPSSASPGHRVGFWMLLFWSKSACTWRASGARGVSGPHAGRAGACVLYLHCEHGLALGADKLPLILEHLHRARADDRGCSGKSSDQHNVMCRRAGGVLCWHMTYP
jgi:hypothetical protein